MTIELENISKCYDKAVIDNLSYTFTSGRIYVIKGVSGCGKTTLLNIIGAVEKDFTGNVNYISEEKFCGASYVFQNSLLLSGLTVFENLQLIRDDSEEILRLLRQLKTEDLTDKYPEQLSGGERQRVAVARALLINSPVFIADEPTASLDKANSISIAEMLASLKSAGRVIIIATHENYFDEYADEIIYLGYGKIENIEKNEPVCKTLFEEDNKMRKSEAHLSDVKYVLKRNPKLFKISSILPFALAFLIVLSASAFQNNFDDEYLESIKEMYPMDMVVLPEIYLKSFKYKDDLKVYKKYTAAENGTKAYGLLEKKDSVLNVDGMIEFGKFPESDMEILTDRAFIEGYFKSTDYASYVGSELEFKNMKFKISGILTDLTNDAALNILNGDIYYRRDARGDNNIFIPYETMKKIGTLIPDSAVIAVYDGLFENTAVRKELYRINDNYINDFYYYAESAQLVVNVIIVILAAVLLLSFFTACVFMMSIIGTQLFYRKKEIGYLQIFSLSKKRIKKILVTQYMLKTAASAAASAVLYFIAAFIYFLFNGSFPMFNVIHTLLMFLLMFSVFALTVSSCAKKILKKSVTSLIN